ncbi:hypothetical protein FO013_21235 [Brevibacterium aurantiacum]|uniref:HK97 gp10 family phage protein n=1 Tax=Brevibacterium aurantiacum TaxID=273384 RepID=A0A556C4P9_BREAU|nr:hypothetical protein FO013_21235 [Brevibacterium aurantiacum]
MKSIRAAQLKGADLAAEYLLGESNSIVPIEEATLERSGAASTQQSSKGTTLAVSYDTPYAVRQHEEVTWNHDAGRKAKYLEATFNSKNGKALQVIADTVKGAIK